MRNFLAYTILDNPLQNIIWFFIIILFAIIFKRYLSVLIGKLIFKIFLRYAHESYGKEFQRRVLKPMDFLIVLVIIKIALEALNYPESWKITVFDQPLQELLEGLTWVTLLICFTWLLLRIVDFISYVLRSRAFYTESRVDDQLVPFIKDVMKIFIIISALLVLLGGIFGLDITSLLAGVGIGGLAIAFAAQESIKDLFGTLTVFLDKPFTVGDLVKVGDVQGTVERVGIRSTRLRTPDMTLVTIPNKKMLDTNVDNLASRHQRRIRTLIKVTYETSPEQLRKILSDLRSFFSANQETNEDFTVLFDEFGENSINIVIEYFIPYIPMNEHNARKEEINFKIMEIVTANGSSFAFPVRALKIDPSFYPTAK